MTHKHVFVLNKNFRDTHTAGLRICSRRSYSVGLQARKIRPWTRRPVHSHIQLLVCKLRAATALDMQAGTKNLAPTTSCKQWSLLQNSLPSGPLSREAPQVSEQPLRINSFGAMRSTNLTSKHLLNNPHDVFFV